MCNMNDCYLHKTTTLKSRMLVVYRYGTLWWYWIISPFPDAAQGFVTAVWYVTVRYLVIVCLSNMYNQYALAWDRRRWMNNKKRKSRLSLVCGVEGYYEPYVEDGY